MQPDRHEKSYFSHLFSDIIYFGFGGIVSKNGDEPFFSISTHNNESSATLQCNPYTSWRSGTWRVSLSHRWLVSDACWESGGHCRSMWSAWGSGPRARVATGPEPNAHRREELSECHGQDAKPWVVRGEKLTHNSFCFGHLSSFSPEDGAAGEQDCSLTF